MSSSTKCGACNKPITNAKETIKCTTCIRCYDLDCVGINPKRLNTMVKDKSSWKCPACRSMEPKTGNTNTPVRSEAQHIQDIVHVTTRNAKLSRRKSSDDNPNIEANISSDTIRTIIREELAHTLNASIKSLVSDKLNLLNEKMSSFEDALNFMNAAYEEVKKSLEEKTKIIDTLKKTNDSLTSTVTELGNRLNVMEQYLRETNIEVTGVPEDKEENIPTLVVQLANVVNCPLTAEDITHCSRVARLDKLNSRPRAIIVKLKSRILRNNLLSATIKFNKRETTKLNTKHLGYGCSPAPVYISEHLSPANKHLFAETRRKIKETGYKYAWIKDGRIFARKDEKCPALHIRTPESLELII